MRNRRDPTRSTGGRQLRKRKSATAVAPKKCVDTRKRQCAEAHSFLRVPGSRLFNDPDAAPVFGGIMRFAKRIGLFDLAGCARNEGHLTAHVGEM